MINFPSNPSVNQLFQDPASPQKWTWDGIRWRAVVGPTNIVVNTPADLPSTSIVGTLAFVKSTEALHIFTATGWENTGPRDTLLAPNFVVTATDVAGSTIADQVAWLQARRFSSALILISGNLTSQPPVTIPDRVSVVAGGNVTVTFNGSVTMDRGSSSSPTVAFNGPAGSTFTLRGSCLGTIGFPTVVIDNVLTTFGLSCPNADLIARGLNFFGGAISAKTLTMQNASLYSSVAASFTGNVSLTASAATFATTLTINPGQLSLVASRCTVANQLSITAPGGTPPLVVNSMSALHASPCASGIALSGSNYTVSNGSHVLYGQTPTGTASSSPAIGSTGNNFSAVAIG